MEQTKVIYFVTSEGKNPVSDFLDSLNEKQQAKLLRVINTIKSYGLTAILPHLKKIINSPLWEIRILGKDNIRVIYLIATEKSIVLLHGFIKKTQKTAQKDLTIALSRYYIWEKNNK